MKRTLSLLLTMLISFGILASMQVCVYATNSGETGDCTWTLDGTVLTISGNGEMANYDSSFPAPWGTSITSVIIEDGVTIIGWNAFKDCTSLTSVTIPESVTIIGDVAFFGCTSLENVYITDIAAWCGIGFDNTFLRRSSNPLNNGANLYLNGELVTDLIIPDNVTSIGKWAFYGCKSLTSITIPDSVTSICGEPFYACTSLTSITIPDSVTSIGYDAFNGCDNLVKVITPCGSYASEYFCDSIDFHDSILELIHIPGDWIIDTPATSTTDGLKHKECTVCGKTIETELIAVEKSNEDGIWKIAFFVLLFLVIVAIIFLCIKKKREKIKETNNQTDRQ